ncbi:uncharacterized protein LOC128999646 [Macrosteles quadrilineatus]|uniref:uncharacterized protein LOC128999646 n=1 Tax=Macrosteles quadrilineatus TaxID=74068 RepID=UPI0023E23C30|nr:uncharacterized protein LOC128999646 [Macrosteles quadrilineatus]
MEDTGEVPCSIEVGKQVEEISDLITLRALKNPNLFSKALSSFHSALKNMKNESSLLSAFHQFGKPTYSPLTCKKYKTTIPVQPTAVARRKFTTKGRRCLQSGRPAKVNFTSEHGYSKKKNSRPGKVPHSLQESVDRNHSSSKKH